MKQLNYSNVPHVIVSNANGIVMMETAIVRLPVTSFFSNAVITITGNELLYHYLSGDKLKSK